MTPVILIVEDEADLVELLRYNLEREGYEVLATPSGEEALLIVDERHVDLMLLDWMLPHMSGIEVCRQLRRKPESRALPVIMLTARGEQADRVRGLDTGADDYVTKPFVTKELMARIRNMPGAENLPMYCVGDLHATLTPRMGALSDCMIFYRECPHTDAYDSAVLTSELLARCLKTGVRSKHLVLVTPIIWPPR